MWVLVYARFKRVLKNHEILLIVFMLMGNENERDLYEDENLNFHF